MGATIPTSHAALLGAPHIAALTTLLPGGQPQTSAVWCSFDGSHVFINTMKGFRKEQNMRRDPRVSILAMDPADGARFIEVGGTVELIEDGAMEHLNQLAWDYAEVNRYFGGCVPAHFEQTERPVIGKIHAQRVVVLDGAAT